jgi:hypothetical protein
MCVVVIVILHYNIMKIVTVFRLLITRYVSVSSVQHWTTHFLPPPVKRWKVGLGPTGGFSTSTPLPRKNPSPSAYAWRLREKFAIFNVLYSTYLLCYVRICDLRKKSFANFKLPQIRKYILWLLPNMGLKSSNSNLSKIKKFGETNLQQNCR